MSFALQIYPCVLITYILLAKASSKHHHRRDANSFSCDDNLLYNEATSITSSIYAGFVFAANDLFSTNTADRFRDYMAEYCSDDFIYEATINNVANEQIARIVFNNLDDVLYSGNSELNLPPVPAMLRDASTRRTLSNSNFIFQCIEDDDGYQIVAESYYAVRIQKKETLEAIVVINYVKTYWRYNISYSDEQHRWLWAKVIFQGTNPFFSFSQPASNSAQLTHETIFYVFFIMIVILLAFIIGLAINGICNKLSKSHKRSYKKVALEPEVEVYA